MEDAVRRHLRHNIVVNMLEGIAFWMGVPFYSYQTVLPLFVSKLTDSPFALGFLATVGNSGWLLPQLFTARWVQRTRVKKHIIVRVGFFSERLPLVVLALIAWGLVYLSPNVALALTLVVAAWGAYGSGLIAISWQAMIAKVIPQDIRGRFFGVTSALGMAGGALAAGAVTYILNAYPFPRGFAISFTLGALFSLLSWFFISLTREPPDPDDTVPEDDASFWSEIPHILRSDRNYFYYLVARAVGALGSMGTGFLAVYAITRWKLSDGQAGVFNGISMAAQLVAYLVLGLLADRRGHKVVLEIGAVASAVGFLIAGVTPVPHLIYVSFAGLGLMQASYIVSGMMIVPEFAPPDRLALYFGLASTLPGLVAVATPMLGATLASAVGYPSVFAISGLASLASWGVLFARVQDPRQRLT